MATLGAYPLFDSTESRYAEIPREMLAAGDWVTPRLDPETPFWGKPPLSFWMTAVSFKVFGFTEFAARFPHFLASLATVWLTFLVAARLYDRRTGIMAALILATTGTFHALASGVMTDLALTATVTLALGGVLGAMTAPTRAGRRAWGYGAFAGLGLALLAKGPVGAVLIVLPVGVWLTLTRQWKRAATLLPWVGGGLLTLALALPWYLLAERNTPGFLDYFIVGEHVRRFLTPGWEGDLYGNPHEHPIGMIWLYGLASTLPWGILLGVACLRMRQARRSLRTVFLTSENLFFALWFLSPMIFFTFSRNIIITYVLPGLPGFALLTVRILETALSERTEPPSRNRITSLLHRPSLQWNAVLLAPVAYGITALAILPHVGEQRSQKRIVERLDVHDPARSGQFVYLKEAPDSADFYSAGRAKAFRKENLEGWESLVRNSTRDFVVIGDDHVETFARIAETVGGQFDEIFRHNEDILLYERLDSLP